MPISTERKRAVFRRLHDSGCFVLPNPWDVGSARLFAAMGFKALASTSSGYAWSQGRPDNKVTCEDVLSHLDVLCAATDLPVNADFESGFAETPQGVAANVRRCIDTGVAGLSIEDATGDARMPLYDFHEAIERVAAARSAIDASGQDVMLIGRCEGFLTGETDLNKVISRLVAYSEAGAECLYAPGVTKREQVAEVVKAVAPKPVNLLINAPFITVAEAGALGVRPGGGA